MKGLILAGGKGTRLRPFTFTGAKQLVPIANKPILFYAIEEMVRFGIKDIGMIVGDTKEQIIDAVGNGSKWGVNIRYIEQSEPLGISHAVEISRDFLENDKFLIILGDNFVEEDISSISRKFQTDETINAMLVLKRVTNPWDFGVVEVDENRVISHVEKPTHPKSDLIGIGYYFLDHHVWDAFAEGFVKPSARGELEITNLYQYYIEKGYFVGYYILQQSWVDTGKTTDVLDANRLVLSKLTNSQINGQIDDKSQIEGYVVIDEGSRIDGSHIRGPVMIGKNCYVKNAYIGPFTSISHDTIVENCEVEHCVILQNCRISNVNIRIDSSVIGKNVTITKRDSTPRVLSLEIGDYCSIKLP